MDELQTSIVIPYSVEILHLVSSLYAAKHPLPHSTDYWNCRAR